VPTIVVVASGMVIVLVLPAVILAASNLNFLVVVVAFWNVTPVSVNDVMLVKPLLSTVRTSPPEVDTVKILALCDAAPTTLRGLVEAPWAVIVRCVPVVE
jgi:hypothetical protein